MENIEAGSGATRRDQWVSLWEVNEWAGAVVGVYMFPFDDTQTLASCCALALLAPFCHVSSTGFSVLVCITFESRRS